MGAIGDKLKSSKKKMFGRKSRDGSATPTSEPATPTHSSTGTNGSSGNDGGGVTPGKPILAAAAPPKGPHGGKPPDMSKVSGVDAQPKPAEGDGASAPRPTQGQQEGLTKGENTALAGEPDQAAKDAVNEKRGSPTGEVAGSNLPPTPDDRLIPATTVLLVRAGCNTF